MREREMIQAESRSISGIVHQTILRICSRFLRKPSSVWLSAENVGSIISSSGLASFAARMSSLIWSRLPEQKFLSFPRGCGLTSMLYRATILKAAGSSASALNHTLDLDRHRRKLINGNAYWHPTISEGCCTFHCQRCIRCHVDGGVWLLYWFGLDNAFGKLEVFSVKFNWVRCPYRFDNSQKFVCVFTSSFQRRSDCILFVLGPTQPEPNFQPSIRELVQCG